MLYVRDPPMKSVLRRILRCVQKTADLADYFGISVKTVAKE